MVLVDRRAVAALGTVRSRRGQIKIRSRREIAGEGVTGTIRLRERY
jgi:hypothetical protein